MALKDPKTVAAMFAAISLATAGVAEMEGYMPRGYRDVVGVATDCYGRTGAGVVVGKVTPDDVCHTAFAEDLLEHALAINPCIKVNPPIPSWAAFISFSYNVGAGAFCKSTLVKRLNAGDLAGACSELSRWTKAGGVEWPGLVRRRKYERELCEKGLTA